MGSKNKKIELCAIGDSFTYLNDHLDETDYRVKNGYLSRLAEFVPNLHVNNIGINGSNTKDWIDKEIPKADIYTLLLGTNDWNSGIKIGSGSDYKQRKLETILGNLGRIIDHIRVISKAAPIIVMNPVERGDFVYLFDQNNHAKGSYTAVNGQYLADISDHIFRYCRGENIHSIDLYHESGFTQDNVVQFKRVQIDGAYMDCSYPDYTRISFDPKTDIYPYPLEAIGLTYDGLHPSEAGNQRIAKILGDKIKTIIH